MTSPGTLTRMTMMTPSGGGGATVAPKRQRGRRMEKKKEEEDNDKGMASGDNDSGEGKDGKGGME